MTLMMVLADLITQVWSWAALIAFFGQIAWQIGQTDRLDRAWRRMARVHQELWLFAPPGLLINVVHIWHSSQPWMIVLSAWSVLFWWNMRKWPDDDNRWQRRGRRAVEAVRRSGARLVVVPAGSAS